MKPACTDTTPAVDGNTALGNGFNNSLSNDRATGDVPRVHLQARKGHEDSNEIGVNPLDSESSNNATNDVTELASGAAGVDIEA